MQKSLLTALSFNHLPEIPSAEEIKNNGQNIGEMNMLLLKKVEELTLYMIEHDRLLKNQVKDYIKLKKQNARMRKQMALLLNSLKHSKK